jgi:Tfp pilus assembly protein PilX
LILGAVLSVTLASSEVIISGLQISRERYDSTVAFFAAEAGAEHLLWEIRSPAGNVGSSPHTGYCDTPDSIFCFNNSDPNDVEECTSGNCSAPWIDEVVQNNDSIYSANFNYSIGPAYSTTTITAFGRYRQTGRKVQLKWRSN